LVVYDMIAFFTLYATNGIKPTGGHRL